MEYNRSGFVTYIAARQFFDHIYVKASHHFLEECSHHLLFELAVVIEASQSSYSKRVELNMYI